MSDEFVDFYQILELPLDAERSDVRKRINELYVEAQKNLDHRNFDTRVRNQQLFEITLPQARYILLDAGRRDDYDRLVRDSRAPAEGAPASAPKVAPAQTTEISQNVGGFKMEPTGIPGETPSIDALPDEAPDPETVAREREEMWNKWKTGLQSAMEREAAKEKARPTEAATPLADRIEAVEMGAPQPPNRRRERDGHARFAAARRQRDGAFRPSRTPQSQIRFRRRRSRRRQRDATRRRRARAGRRRVRRSRQSPTDAPTNSGKTR